MLAWNLHSNTDRTQIPAKRSFEHSSEHREKPDTSQRQLQPRLRATKLWQGTLILEQSSLILKVTTQLHKLNSCSWLAKGLKIVVVVFYKINSIGVVSTNFIASIRSEKFIPLFYLILLCFTTL